MTSKTQAMQFPVMYTFPKYRFLWVIRGYSPLLVAIQIGELGMQLHCCSMKSLTDPDETQVDVEHNTKRSFL